MNKEIEKKFKKHLTTGGYSFVPTCTITGCKICKDYIMEQLRTDEFEGCPTCSSFNHDCCLCDYCPKHQIHSGNKGHNYKFESCWKCEQEKYK